MHGVSEVIAIILILMITISLAGLAYMFMSTTMSDVTASAGSTVDTTTSSMLTSFKIESMDIANVYIRNTGQNPLTDFSVYVNDLQAHFNMTPTSIMPGQIGTISIFDFIEEDDIIKIMSSSGFYASKKAPDPCSKAIGCWKFEGSGNIAYDSSVNGNDGNVLNGIDYGFISSNLQFIADQMSGAANDGEFDIVCPGGDSYCWFNDMEENHTTLDIGSGVICGDGNTGQGYIMYSAQDVHTRFPDHPPYSSGSDNFVCVKYDGGWKYDDNNDWYGFDPVSTDILVASTDFSADQVVSLDVHPTATTGKYGNALSFDGSNDYVQVYPYTYPAYTEMTISALIKLDGAIGTRYGILQHQNDGATWHANDISVTVEGVASARFYDGNVRSVTGTTVLETGKWYLIAATYKYNDFIRLFVNGIQEGTPVAVGTFGSGFDRVRIGTYSSGYYFNGTIDEVRIYDRAIY